MYCFNDFLEHYINNSTMLFDKYVTEGDNIIEESKNYYVHYVEPLFKFLIKLKRHGYLYELFNISFMDANIVNDGDFIDKEYDREYFAAMYLAKFTFDVYTNSYKKGTFGEVIASIIYLFDKGSYNSSYLDEIIRADYRIRSTYQKYIDKLVFKSKRRKLIRKDIDGIFKELSKKFIDSISEINKRNVNNDPDIDRIPKLVNAAEKVISFIKTLALIDFETWLHGITWNATLVKCKLYKDMWECRWDSSFNKVKAMDDFCFMFYRVYYIFVG